MFTALVLVFMFMRPQGLIAASDLWRGREGAARHD
jgi:hypothetical protein